MVQILKEFASKTVAGKVMACVVEYLQDLATPEHIKQTKMTLSNLATVFSPLFLRCPSDDPATLLANAEFETLFMFTLLQHWRRS